jgi:hypothetical protein
MKPRIIRAISTHAGVNKAIAEPIGEAIVVFPPGEGPFVVDAMIDIDEFGIAKVDAVWGAGDPDISHPDLSFDAVDGEYVVKVFRSRPNAD